jgi:hypothetical protein
MADHVAALFSHAEPPVPDRQVFEPQPVWRRSVRPTAK